MKKKLIVVLALAVVCLGITACGGKKSKKAEGEAAAQTEQAGNEAESSESRSAGDAQEPQLDEHMLCVFYLQDAGKVDDEGNPVTVQRHFISDASAVGCPNIPRWVMVCQDPRYNFNVDGWHFVGRDIVNADETVKICDEWTGNDAASLSSFCTVTTEPYSKPSKVATYEYFMPGDIYTIWEEDCPFKLGGVKLLGNHHSYVGEELEAYASGECYGSGFQTAFYLNEYIRLFVDAEGPLGDIQVICVPHIDNYEGVHANEALLEKACFIHGIADKADDGSCFEDYVHIELPVGLYDLLFTLKGKPVCYVPLLLTKEEE